MTTYSNYLKYLNSLTSFANQLLKYDESYRVARDLSYDSFPDDKNKQILFIDKQVQKIVNQLSKSLDSFVELRKYYGPEVKDHAHSVLTKWIRKKRSEYDPEWYDSENNNINLNIPPSEKELAAIRKSVLYGFDSTYKEFEDLLDEVILGTRQIINKNSSSKAHPIYTINSFNGVKEDLYCAFDALRNIGVDFPGVLTDHQTKTAEGVCNSLHHQLERSIILTRELGLDRSS